jgi:hypothetical protein
VRAAKIGQKRVIVLPSPAPLQSKAGSHPLPIFLAAIVDFQKGQSTDVVSRSVNVLSCRRQRCLLPGEVRGSKAFVIVEKIGQRTNKLS